MKNPRNEQGDRNGHRGSKLALAGQSFGGYNTIALITQTTRFKTAIVSASAFINLFEGYTFFVGEGDSTGYYEEGQGDMGGSPWQFRERYIENSPLFALDKVTTPVMLECGKEDSLCKGNGETYVSLRRLGQEMTFLQYEGEGHVPLGRANVIDFWNRRIEFLTNTWAFRGSLCTTSGRFLCRPQ